MASALSAFIKGDQEIKEKLVSMDTTLKKMYSAQLNEYKLEDKHRRRQEQAEKRKKADKKSPMGAFKKDKKDDKKEKGFLGKLFEGLMKNPALLKFLAALGGITVGALALKKAFDDLKEGTVLWLREFKRQTAEAFGNLKTKIDEGFAKFKKNLDEFFGKFKIDEGFAKFKKNADEFFTNFQNSKAWKGFKKGLNEAGETIAKKFPKAASALDDIGKKFNKFGKGITKKGGLLNTLSDAKIGKNFGKGLKGLGGLGKRIPLIGELVFAGVTAKERLGEGQGAGQAALGTGAEVAGGWAGAALGGKGGAALGATIGTFIAPGIGSAIGGAIGGLSGAVLGAFGGAELMGALSDKLYPQISQWVQDVIVAPFGNLMTTIGDFWQTGVVEPIGNLMSTIRNHWQTGIVEPIGNLMSTIGNFWTTNVVEPFLANPVVKWLTPIVESMIGLTKSFVNFQMELAGAIGRITGAIFEAIGNEAKYWGGLIGNEIEYWTGFIGGKIDNEVEYWSGLINDTLTNIGASITGWWSNDVVPWWMGVAETFTTKWNEFLTTIDPVIKVFKAIKGVADQLVSIAKDKLIGALESLAGIIQDRIVGFFKGPAKLLDRGSNWLKNLVPGKQQGGVVQGYQTGGFVGTVPNQGGDGDRFGTMVQSGSVVMNQNAAGYQSGGMVPVMLEQGEFVVPPGPDAGAALMMNNMFPRFQKGGEVTQDKAGGARGTQPPKMIEHKKSRDYQAEKEQKEQEKTTGKKALIAAAESSIGLSQGVGEQCANTTRAVLAKAGHPAAQKTTSTGNLDPEGLAYNGPGFAASFAGSDMGTVKNDYKSTSAGDIILWKDTYGGFAPGAITHVGMKGEGSDVYHHGRAEGWRKQGGYPLSNKFAAGIDLNGEASGAPDSSSIKPTTLGNIGGGLLNLTGDVGEFFGEIMKGLGDILGDIGGGILSGLANYGNDSAAAGKPGAGGNGAASVNNPNAKALLNAIADAEGTSHMPNQGYNTHFGHGQTDDLSQHPRKIVNKGGYSSDAFGRYQFLSTTWDGAMGGSMEPGRQDQGALKLVSGRGVNISDGLSEKEIYRLGGEWASIEGGPSMTKGGSYGAQAKYSAPEFMKMYTNYGGKIQGKQSGGAVTAKPSTSNMVSKSQEQFLDRLAASVQPVIVPMPMGGGGGGNDGGGMTGTGGSQTNVPNLSSHPSGNIALDNAFRLSLGAAFG